MSWNVKTLLERCLLSIEKHLKGLDIHVVVVDNASTDGSVHTLKSLQRTILRGRLSVVANKHNVGFARGCNQAVEVYDRHQKPTGESDPAHSFIVLLNPDTEFHGNALKSLLHVAQKNERVGVVGPTMFNEEGTIQQSIRRFPGVASQAFVMLKLQHLADWFPLYRRYMAADLDYKKEQFVEQLQGACFMVRRSCWDQLEGLDEHFFLWFEEVDFCRRAWDNGWEVHYVPTPGLVHHGAESFSQVEGLQKQRYFHNSILWYIAKHKGFFAWFILWLLQPIGLMLSRISQVYKRIPFNHPMTTTGDAKKDS